MGAPPSCDVHGHFSLIVMCGLLYLPVGVLLVVACGAPLVVYIWGKMETSVFGCVLITNCALRVNYLVVACIQHSGFMLGFSLVAYAG